MSIASRSTTVFYILLIFGKRNFLSIHCCGEQLPGVLTLEQKAREIFKSARILKCVWSIRLFSLFSLDALIKVFLSKSSATNQFKKIQSGFVFRTFPFGSRIHPVFLALRDFLGIRCRLHVVWACGCYLFIYWKTQT